MDMVRGKNKGWEKNSFVPIFPDKCANVRMNKKIIYRSSWEKKFMNYCDLNVNIIRWGSEIIKIPYIYDVDNKLHNYIPDFYIEQKNPQGKIEKILIEIKPKKQSKHPVLPKNKTKKAMANYQYSVMEFVKNNNKWKYALRYCETRNMKFRILTENSLF
jgi:hypothetical protein